MEINLSHCNYSYANAIGNTFKQPLFKLVSTIAIGMDNPGMSRARRISRIALNVLLVAVFVLPATLSYLIGKSISYFSKTQIDHRNLHLAPSEIKILAEQEEQIIDLGILSKKFKELNLKEHILPGQTSKQDSFFRMCNGIANEHAFIYEDNSLKRSLFCKQVSINLKNIIKKIESGKILKDKEESILIELADASTRCFPTWLEVSTRLSREVSGQAEPVRDKLLTFIQNYKEDIILEFCQREVGAQWHALNYVRNILGNELGLNTTLSEYDPYATQTSQTFFKGLVKWLFLQKYENANRLISGIQTKINFEAYDVSYYDFLVNLLEQQGIEDPRNQVTERFYDEDYKLNADAVNLMLKSIRVLK